MVTYFSGSHSCLDVCSNNRVVAFTVVAFRVVAFTVVAFRVEANRVVAKQGGR